MLVKGAIGNYKTTMDCLSLPVRWSGMFVGGNGIGGSCLPTVKKTWDSNLVEMSDDYPSNVRMK